MKASEKIAYEMELLDSRRRNLNEKYSKLSEQLRAALLAEAEERYKDHPMLGKAVKKTVIQRRKSVTRRGVVTIFDREKHRALRGIYGVEQGDLFVLSHGGQTGYPWQDYRSFGRDREPPAWELDQ